MAKARKVAHFIHSADVYRARNGERVPTVCGKNATGTPPADAPICQACVIAQLGIDDASHATALQERTEHARQDGIALGERQARATVMQEIREAAEQHAERAKAG